MTGEAIDIFLILIIILNSKIKKIPIRNEIGIGTDLFSFLFRASRAEAEDIQFVALLNVAVFFDQLLLNGLQLGTVNFLEFATFETDQMVVVFMAMLVLEALGSVTEIDLPAHAGFAHQLDRSRHGRISDAFMFLSDQVEQLLNR